MLSPPKLNKPTRSTLNRWRRFQEVLGVDSPALASGISAVARLMLARGEAYAGHPRLEESTGDHW